MNFSNYSGLIVALVVVVLVGLTSSKEQFPAAGRKTISGTLLFRLLAVLLIGLSLSEPYLMVDVRDARGLLALVDISDSVDEQSGETMLKQLDSYRSGDLAIDLLPFSRYTASRPVSDWTPSDFRSLKLSWSKLNIGETDLEQALENISGQEQVLLVSDGFQTKGQVERVLPILKSRNLKVFPLVPTQWGGTSGSFRISNVYAPLVVPAKKSVDIRVSIENAGTRKRKGQLKVVQGEKTILEEIVEVEPGQELLKITESDPLQEGIKEVKATLTPLDTSLPASSETVYLSGERREKVMLVSSNEKEQKFLLQVLETQSYQLDSILSAGTRLSKLPDFRKYEAVVLNNIPLGELPRSSAALLEEYVRDGGALMMLGGNQSFGLGGYKSTSIEDALPVAMIPPQKEKKRLNVAVQLVLDKSGSMKHNHKIDFLQAAAAEVIKSLKDDDFLGIIVFDNTPWKIVEMGQLKYIRQKALERLQMIFPKGKTNLLSAIDVGGKQLQAKNAGRKHMIILTDGEVPNAYQERGFYHHLIKELRFLGITVSTFMLGNERDIILKEIAELGGGAFHRTRDPRSLPRLFLKDIKVSVGEKTQKENHSYDVRQGTDPIKSTKLRSFPPVLGYVQVKKKEKAKLELIAYADQRAEPLLISWNYGKGRASAFTSDVSGRWSYHWIRWSKYFQFWADVVDSLVPDDEDGEDTLKFDLRYYLRGGTLILDLSVFSEKLAGQISASLKHPDGKEQEVDFTALSRGSYQAEVGNVLAGKYEVKIKAGIKDLPPVAFYLSGELFGERKGKGFNRPALQRLAAKTGGKVNPDADHLKTSFTAKREKVPLGGYLMFLGAIFYCLYILSREGVRWRDFKSLNKA